MKCISIQIHPDKAPSLNIENILSVLDNAGIASEISNNAGDGKHANLSIYSNDLKESWSVIKISLLQMPEVEESSIIVCEGDNGWDDYLLLHHFDSSQELDEL